MYALRGVKMATFQGRFFELKTEKGVSFEEIAEAVNTNRTSLAKFVKGQATIRNDAIDMIQLLANYFCVSKAYLLGESDLKTVDEEIDKEAITLAKYIVDKGITKREIEEAISVVKRMRDLYGKK